MNDIEFGLWGGEFADFELGQKIVLPQTPEGKKLWCSDDGQRAYGIIGGKYHLFSVKLKGKTLLCIHQGATNNRTEAEKFLDSIPIEILDEPASGKTYFATLIKLGPQIIRSFFDTIINPIIHYLKSEQQLLAEKNWTWRFRPGHLEAIRYIEQYIPAEAQENLEYFVSYFPTIEEKIKEHDNEVASLFVQCKQLQRALEEHPELKELYDHITSAASLTELNTSLNNLFGAYPAQEHIDLLAQYIVNNTGDLPSYHSVSSLWNRHRQELLRFLVTPSIAQLNNQTVRAGKKISAAGKHLLKSLKDLRDLLSSEYDVPITVGLPASHL
jgi:hypothetical protein